MAEFNPLTVLGWAVPRPTGRWHQSFVVTDKHVWITPELSFENNEKMEAAAAAGIEAFHTFMQGGRWADRPQQLELEEVNGLHWNPTVGLMRLRSKDNRIISATIADRAEGEVIQGALKQAIDHHAARQPAEQEQAPLLGRERTKNPNS